MYIYISQYSFHNLFTHTLSMLLGLLDDIARVSTLYYKEMCLEMVQQLSPYGGYLQRPLFILAINNPDIKEIMLMHTPKWLHAFKIFTCNFSSIVLPLIVKVHVLRIPPH